MSTQTVKLLEKSLDFSILKQRAISNNIANVQTENYLRQDVSFEDVLNGSINGKMKATNSGHFAGSEVKMVNQPDFTIKEDYEENENASGVNNVDIDQEMAEMAENQLLFKFAAQKLKAHYTNLQSIIRGGR